MKIDPRSIIYNCFSNHNFKLNFFLLPIPLITIHLQDKKLMNETKKKSKNKI